MGGLDNENCVNGGDHNFTYAGEERVYAATTGTLNTQIGSWERSVCTRCGYVRKFYIELPKSAERKA